MSECTVRMKSPMLRHYHDNNSLKTFFGKFSWKKVFIQAVRLNVTASEHKIKIMLSFKTIYLFT